MVGELVPPDAAMKELIGLIGEQQRFNLRVVVALQKLAARHAVTIDDVNELGEIVAGMLERDMRVIKLAYGLGDDDGN
jgi:hypothetical protein